MEQVIVNSYDEFAAFEGKTIGTTEPMLIDQNRINLFADATSDHQWIHVDTERAAVESPYKSTIVHGYLTLSVLPKLWQDLIQVNNIKMLVNYGMESMKFGQPVLSGQSIQLTAGLKSIQNLRGIAKVTVNFTLAVAETGKKALEGNAIFLYYFDN